MFTSLFCASSALLLFGAVGNAIPLDKFYDFGMGHDYKDHYLPQSDDGYQAVSLPIPFQIFNYKQTNVFVNKDGILSFGKEVEVFTPKKFPIKDDLQIIAPFWADVDTTSKGNVSFRTTFDESLLTMAKITIGQAFSDQMSFEPRMLFIATWYRVGYYRSRTCLTNTFQCILVTNGTLTFAIFNYADGEMQWTTGDASGGRCGLHGAAAQVGINAGDGIRFTSVQGSGTIDILGNVSKSSNVKSPGLWIYRVDDEEIIYPDGIVPLFPVTIPPPQVPTTIATPPPTTTEEPCRNHFSEPLTIEPRFGHDLGGIPIYLEGPCFNNDDEIKCLFEGTKNVTGIVLDRDTALCVSPTFETAGWKSLSLFAYRNEQPSYSGATRFYSGYPEDTSNINVTIGQDSTSLLLVNGSDDIVTVKWDPKSLLPRLDPSSFHVNIHLYRLENNEWKPFPAMQIARTNNTKGIANFSIPKDITFTNDRDIYPVAIRISVGEHISLPITPLERVLNYATQKSISLWRTDLFYRDINRSELFDRCMRWYEKSSGVGETIRSRVPCCVETQKKAEAPNSGFVRDRRHELVAFLHPGATSCYLQETITSNNSGSGQQCCYDKYGDLITGPNSGGTADLVAPKGNLSYSTYYRHLLEDIIPNIYCCKAEYSAATCSLYYRERPSDKAENCKLLRPGFSYGDPHFVTMDGFKYTFNGVGEFVLIETVNDIFTLQGRMVQMRDINEKLISSAYYSAIVGRQFDSDTVQFQLADNDEIDVLINGELVDFKDLSEHHFNNVILKKSADAISAVFSSGVHIKLKAANEMISGLLVSLPNNSYYWSQTSGLLGNYNGNKSDDLIPRGGTDVISNTSSSYIHEHFGLTWIVRRPEDSLFTYSKGEDWSIYYNPNFVPVFDPSFSNLELEEKAKDICGSYDCCMFDIAVTGREEIGNVTANEYRYFEEITLPVVCNPSCGENGVCVKNDTCRCSDGFSGVTCAKADEKECEENMKEFCKNGGTCNVKGVSAKCTCQEGYTGLRCEVPEHIDHSI